MIEEINEEIKEKKERTFRRICIYISAICLILMIIVIPVSIYLVKIVQDPPNPTTVISTSEYFHNQVIRLNEKKNEVKSYFTIFSNSSTKYSNRLIPNFQNSGSVTSKPRSSPISFGDKLLPAANAFLNLGTNSLPSCRYF